MYPFLHTNKVHHFKMTISYFVSLGGHDTCGGQNLRMFNKWKVNVSHY